MVMGFFQQKPEYTKVSSLYLKNFEHKKGQKISTNQKAGKLNFIVGTKTIYHLKARALLGAKLVSV